MHLISLFFFLVLSMFTTALAAECPSAGEVMLNELSYHPKDSAFIELWGPPGQSLGCLQLIYANAGSEGVACSTGSVIRFSDFIDEEAGVDLIFDESGYFLLATAEGVGVDLVTNKADLQNGPVDGVYLVNAELGLSAEGILDSVAYGGPMDACEFPVMEGSTYAPEHPSGSSIGRVFDHVDTNENGSDWVLCPLPSPGALNTCPEPVVCGDTSGEIAINELKVGSTSDTTVPYEEIEFVELIGTPGTLLDCYVLQTRNGGPAGDQCKTEEVTPLMGLFLNDQGVAVVEMNLQKTGPDAVELVFLATNLGEISVDSVVWGGAMPACPENIGNGTPANVPDNTQALARCWDQNNDLTDFIAADPTPGGVNECPDGPAPSTCEEIPEGNYVINEIQSGTSLAAFVELHGTPGTRLDCMALVAHNGKEGDACDEYARIDLTGQEIGENGYFVVGTTEGEGVDLVIAAADLQDGPDALSLIFTHREGEVFRVDSVSYGGALPSCAESVGGVGEGEPAKSLKPGKSITRCEGADTDDNAEDFILCNSPSPNGGTSCSCSSTNPNDVVVLQDSDGCVHSSDLALGGRMAFFFFLFAMLMVMALRRHLIRRR